MKNAPDCIDLMRPGARLHSGDVAWVPRETRQRLLDAAVENLRCYLAGRPVNVIGDQT